jgi:hypothetical protein
VFLTADEHPHDALACAGDPAIQTPNFDRLAGQGCRFAGTYCQGPLCQPSRASLITGQYVHRHAGRRDRSRWTAAALRQAQRDEQVRIAQECRSMSFPAVDFRIARLYTVHNAVFPRPGDAAGMDRASYPVLRRRKPMKSISSLILLLVFGPTSLFAAGTLDVYVINVDHGNAVLVVTPAGQSMLLDAGPPGKVYVDRILAAMADADVKRIDYSVVSHYDWDHFATLPELVKKVPIRNFVDHGPELQKADDATSGGRKRNPLMENYVKMRSAGNHIVPLPGAFRVRRRIDLAKHL